MWCSCLKISPIYIEMRLSVSVKKVVAAVSVCVCVGEGGVQLMQLVHFI